MARDNELNWLFFTDLDGTLLNHDDYSAEAALPLLELLEARGVPVIFNSSKTPTELENLRRALGNRHPYVGENGSIVQIPAGTLAAGSEERSHLFGREREEILRHLRELRARQGFLFRSFFDMPVEEIAERTGLSAEDARLAARRRASEPLLWRDSGERLADFHAELEKRALVAAQGGRFLLVTGRTDKGQALRWLADEYRRERDLSGGGSRWCVVAFGDSPNDFEMLEAADVAVVVRSARSEALLPRSPSRVVRTRESGSAGWAEAAGELLDEIPQRSILDQDHERRERLG